MAEPGYLRLFLTFILMSSVYTQLYAASSLPKFPVELKNYVSDCYHVSPGKLTVSNNVVMLEAETSSIKSIGYCGCKTAILSYSVQANQTHKLRIPEYGRFSSFESGRYTFVIDRSYEDKNSQQQYLLRVQCAPPK